jgi:hypothetical protein
MTGLHIGARETVVSIRGPGTPVAPLILPLGHFRHDLPSTLEIEYAIEAIEDALSRIHSAVPAGSTWYTTDPLMGRIAQAAGLAAGPEVVLGRELVELAFNRLAAVSAGRPRTQDNIPTDPEFAAALLILREFMHHLQFASITVSSGTSQRRRDSGETT